MPWKRMLAYITGSVNEDLLRRIEYLLEENRVLRNQLDKRLRLKDHERRTLAEKAVALGKLMADTVTIVKPETILKWHHRLVPGIGTMSLPCAKPGIRCLPKSRILFMFMRYTSFSSPVSISPVVGPITPSGQPP